MSHPNKKRVLRKICIVVEWHFWNRQRNLIATANRKIRARFMVRLYMLTNDPILGRHWRKKGLIKKKPVTFNSGKAY